MKIIKKIEKAVLDYIQLLENSGLDDDSQSIITKGYDDNDTSLVASMSFRKSRLRWIEVSLYNKCYSLFKISFWYSNGINSYRRIEFDCKFYDLKEKEQNELVTFFVENYPKLVDTMVDSGKQNRKKDLLKKRNEIDNELSKL